LLLGCTIILPAVHAQTVNTDEWVCEFCPFDQDQRAELSAGASNVSDDSAYFGDAGGYDEEGVYANVDGEGSYASESHRLQWQVEDLGLDSRYVNLSGGQPGNFDYDVAYRQIPHTRFFTTQTIFVQAGADSLALPAGWVRAPLTSGFTALDPSLTPRNIESERRIFDIGGSYLPSSRIRFSAEYRRQEQDGLKILGGPYFTQSSLLPAPFDYVTDLVDLGARYAGDNGFLSLQYFLSEFDNSNEALRWENPFITAPGAEVAAQAQAPDNSFQQVSLSGNYRFSAYQTVVAFSGARGQMDQHAPFLPYTSNTNLGVMALPRANLDASVDTTNLAFSVSSKLRDKLRLRFAYRYDERDNETAQDNWTRVIADTFLSGETETNTPYSFERARLSVSGDYDILDSLRISGSYERKTIDRDFQEVAEQTEDTGWGQLRWRPNGSLQVDLKGGASERDIDRYDESFAGSLGQNPLLRKYNLAYRYRRFGELTVSGMLPETPVSVTLTGLYADDEYTQSQLGLTSGDELRLAADLSWTISETASLYLTGGYENVESHQLGSEAFAASDWSGSNSDDFYTAGGGVRVRQIADRMDLQIDYRRADGTTKIVVDSAGGASDRLPDLASTLDYLRVRLTYTQSEKMQYFADLRYQRFVAEDWALEGVGPATIPVVLTLGAQPYDEKSLVFGLGVRYRAAAGDSN
jgi:MtrB/PioB family decaheme-associated outer membrane protein